MPIIISPGGRRGGKEGSLIIIFLGSRGGREGRKSNYYFFGLKGEERMEV